MCSVVPAVTYFVRCFVPPQPVKCNKSKGFNEKKEKHRTNCADNKISDQQYQKEKQNNKIGFHKNFQTQKGLRRK